jgi:hypothetical protein
MLLITLHVLACIGFVQGRIVRELWWMNQEFSFVIIIPPWFSMLMYHLGDEQ